MKEHAKGLIGVAPAVTPNLFLDSLGCNLNGLAAGKDYGQLFRCLDRVKYVVKSPKLSAEFISISEEVMSKALKDRDLDLYSVFLPVYRDALYMEPTSLSQAVTSFGMTDKELAPKARKIRNDSVLATAKQLAGTVDHMKDYEIIGTLREGTFGTVKSTIHNDTGDIVAIKQIAPYVPDASKVFPMGQITELKLLKEQIDPSILHSVDSWIEEGLRLTIKPGNSTIDQPGYLNFLGSDTPTKAVDTL